MLSVCMVAQQQDTHLSMCGHHLLQLKRLDERGDYMCPLSAMVEILGSYTVLGNRIWKRKVGEGLGEVIIWLHR